MGSNKTFRLKMLFFSLFRRRSRLLVALTGVTLGATVLCGLGTLCYDIPRQLGREFRSYGANLVFVNSQDGGRLDLDEVDRASKMITPDLFLGLSPFRYESVRRNMVPFTAVGTRFSDLKKTSPYYRVSGRWPTAVGDILLGVDVAEQTGLGEGSDITLNGRTKTSRYQKDFKVVGLVSTGGVEDSYLFMDLSDMEEMTGEKNLADLAEVSLTAGGDRLKEMVETINGENLALKAQLVTRVTRSEETVLSKITFLVYLVTAVVLLLTMICVGTTMMTVVMERRKEIGLKKALGAENKKLALEFLGEGLVLGIVGGMIGSFFGLVLARVITLNVFNRALGSVGPFLVFLTIFLSALVTVLASLGPVKKAMGVDPVVVLKGE